MSKQVHFILFQWIFLSLSHTDTHTHNHSHIQTSLGWEGPGQPTPVPCLKNSMDRGAWWAPVHGVTKSWTSLSN